MKKKCSVTRMLYLYVLIVVLALAIFSLVYSKKEGFCNPGTGSLEYTRRVLSGKKWKCPKGWKDTGCMWTDGTELGEKQCSRKLKKGRSLGQPLQTLPGWTTGYATYYESYPPCCQGEPNYDPNADTEECTKYDGCEYKGQFAGIDGKLTYDQVVQRNIVSFYDAANQKSGDCAKKNKECAWWNTNVKGKKLMVRNPDTGAEMMVEPLDTCNDADTDNKDCTKNAGQGGGTLIDFEIHTSKRFWGGAPKNGAIQWKWV